MCERPIDSSKISDKEFNSTDKLKPRYTSQDVAFLIPTKDRPKKLAKLLESLVLQTEKCSRVIIIDGGESVSGVVKDFKCLLPIEYYKCYPPGQIRQRNMGIGLLDGRTPLVGFLDDDIVFEERAVESIISFWNTRESDTAGISFNVVNTPFIRPSRLRVLLGLETFQPGRVLKSGITSPNTGVSTDIRSQWLCGGATVWRQDILKRYKHKEIDTCWAIGEDLIFSYPIGKEYSLYVCAGARVRHEHEIDYVKKMKHRYHGYTQTMWMFYFTSSNKDLSVPLFLWTLIMRILGKCVRGVLLFDLSNLEFALGQTEGLLRCFKALINRKDIVEVLKDKATTKKYK